MTKKTKQRLIIGSILFAGAAIGVGCAIKIKNQSNKINQLAEFAREEEDKVCEAICFIYENCGAEGVAELTGLAVEEVSDIFNNSRNA